MFDYIEKHRTVPSIPDIANGIAMGDGILHKKGKYKSVVSISGTNG